MNLILNKGLIRLCNINKSSFGSLVTCNYPYKFGGIQNKEENIIQAGFVNKLFGQDVKQGFKQAYVSVLQALKDKDKKFLEQIMEPTLTKSINFQNVQFVNKQSPLQVRIHKSKIILGSQFIRNTNNRKIIKFPNSENIGFDAFIFLEGLRPKNSFSLKLPVLFSFQIYFKGKNKLVNQKKQQNIQKQQSHMLQFQVSNSISIAELMNLMQKMKDYDKFKNIDQLNDVFQILIGKNYQWKIGDMDESLQGNFIITQDNNMGGFGKMGGFF